MKAEQIITKELIFKNEQNEKLTIVSAYKSPKSNLFYKNSLRLYNLLQNIQILKPGCVFYKNKQSNSFLQIRV